MGIRARLEPPRFTPRIRTAPLPLGAAGLVVLYANEGGAPEGAAAAVWEQTDLDFARLSAAAGFNGKQGQVLDIPAPAGLAATRLFVLGAGKVDPARPPAGHGAETGL